MQRAGRVTGNAVEVRDVEIDEEEALVDASRLQSACGDGGRGHLDDLVATRQIQHLRGGAERHRVRAGARQTRGEQLLVPGVGRADDPVDALVDVNESALRQPVFDLTFGPELAQLVRERRRSAVGRRVRAAADRSPPCRRKAAGAAAVLVNGPSMAKTSSMPPSLPSP